MAQASNTAEYIDSEMRDPTQLTPAYPDGYCRWFVVYSTTNGLIQQVRVENRTSKYAHAHLRDTGANPPVDYEQVTAPGVIETLDVPPQFSLRINKQTGAIDNNTLLIEERLADS